MRRRKDLGTSLSPFTYQLFLDDVFTSSPPLPNLQQRCTKENHLEDSSATCPELDPANEADSNLLSPARDHSSEKTKCQQVKTLDFLSNDSHISEDFETETFLEAKNDPWAICLEESFENDRNRAGQKGRETKARKGFSIWSCLQKKQVDVEKQQIPRAYLGARALGQSLGKRHFKRLAKKLRRLAVDRRSTN